MRRPPLIALGFTLAALTASPLFANLELTWPPPLEFSLFAAGYEPRTAGLALRPDLQVSLHGAAGPGVALTALWNDTLSTRFTAGYFKPGIELSGSGAAARSGGELELVPLAALVQLRARRFHRVVPYAEAGLTYLLVPTSTVKPALAAAGVASLRRPDHIALVTGAGLRIGLNGPWVADLDVTYRPFAQSIFVATPSGQVLKDEKIDVHSLVIAGGLAYRF
jgi:outer membrane protein W